MLKKVLRNYLVSILYIFLGLHVLALVYWYRFVTQPAPFREFCIVMATTGSPL